MKTILILDDYNNKILGGCIGTITQHCSRSARKNGFKVIEIYEDSEPDRPPRTDDMFDEGKK